MNNQFNFSLFSLKSCFAKFYFPHIKLKNNVIIEKLQVQNHNGPRCKEKTLNKQALGFASMEKQNVQEMGLKWHTCL